MRHFLLIEASKINTEMLPFASYNYMRCAQKPLNSNIYAAHLSLTPDRIARLPLLSQSRCVAASASHSTGEEDTQGQNWYQEDGSSGETLLQLFREKQPEIESIKGPGAVYLVGTGPGDPGLLTLKAVRLMQTAHVVLYDRLVSEDILRLVNPGALMVYVGKQRSYHTRTQQEIHELLRTFAADAGATVVRLKGGDPFVFGRGGEEAEYLQHRGVSVFCVPGITAAAGISAELGIPLTHRGLATSVRFLTGHAREGGQAALDEAIATAVDPHTTLVVYMGLATLRRLVTELTEGGIDGATPAAAIERGTTPEQRIVWSTLDQLAEEADAATLQSPTLIIIGKVVALALGWQQAQVTGKSLQVPGAHHLPLPVLPGVVPVPEDLIENSSGWRML
jgi:uroporphyrin-III C-methyltransferase